MSSFKVSLWSNEVEGKAVLRYSRSFCRQQERSQLTFKNGVYLGMGWFYIFKKHLSLHPYSTVAMDIWRITFESMYLEIIVDIDKKWSEIRSDITVLLNFELFINPQSYVSNFSSCSLRIFDPIFRLRIVSPKSKACFTIDVRTIWWVGYKV